MKRALNFLKDFRPTRGYNHTFLLYEENDFINEKIDDTPGVYIIEATDGEKFTCPIGSSSIIYIGKSEKLKTRLRTHYRNLKQLYLDKDCDLKDKNLWISSRYQFMRYHGARVYVYKCLKSQDSKDLEAQLLWSCYTKYRCLPIVNAAKSDSHEMSYYESTS